MIHRDFHLKSRGRAVEHHGPLPINVHSAERVFSLILGGGLVVDAIRHLPLRSVLMGLLGAGLIQRGLSGHCRLYGALGIDTTRRRPGTAVPAQQGYKVQQSILIHRPPEVLYQRWQKLEELPQIMSHLQRVDVRGERISHWVAKGPLGTTIEWDAKRIAHRKDRMISWRSLPGSQVETAGSVHFLPRSQGEQTLLRIELKYNPPAGKVGASFAAFLGQGLEQQLQEDLQRFKQAMEREPAPVS